MWTRGISASALAAIALATQASAVSEAPRQTYSERFTTDVPGSSTGRMYTIDFFNPDDPEGKPHSFSHLHVELAEGARFDTSAIAQCKASDAELMAAGPSGCPAESQVAIDETVVDTGFPGPGRYATTDILFFNNEAELVLVATVRESGARVILRAQLGENTIDLDVPMLPGTPPDGGAAKSQRGRWEARPGFLTTPPSCPESGFWVNRITWTYRDGTEQTAESKSPCTRPLADDRAPKIRAAGIPRPCAAGPFRARFRIVDASPLRSARVRLGSAQIATSRRKRFAVRIAAGRLRPGRHTIKVAATDTAGNSTKREMGFRRCAE